MSPGTTLTPASSVHTAPTCVKVSCKTASAMTHAILSPGEILREYLKKSPHHYTTLVYTGDGRNDLCPLLQLGEGDVGVARKGFGLDKALSKETYFVKARVHVIDFLRELSSVIKSYC